MSEVDHSGCVKLRTLSKNWGRTLGGEPMHIIGMPFIQGPALEIVFHTAYGDARVKDIEMYSDSVLFFTLPPLIMQPGVILPPQTRIQATVMVTNDGRNYSNGLDFTYITD